MRDVSECPMCSSTNRELIFERRIVDTFDNPEDNVLDINYVRNWILFRRIIDGQDAIDVSFYLCQGCGLIYFSPRPNERDIALKYQLIDEKHDTLQRERYRRLVSQEDRRAREIHKTITQIKPLDFGSRIMDLGGANGANLKYFVRNSECHVVDYEDRELIAGVQHICYTIDEVPRSLRYDMVLLCHTLEHMVDPLGDLARIHAVLKESGIVYIEVPFGCSGEYARTRNLLTHVNFFSTGSLGFLLEKTGFQVEIIKAQPTLTSTRYLPVIVAIGSKPKEGELISSRFAESTYTITRREMHTSLAFGTFVANLGLVMRNPIGYLRALPKAIDRLKLSGLCLSVPL